jgi:hypothetical protein
MIDIIIVAHTKDKEILNLLLISIKNYINKRDESLLSLPEVVRQDSVINNYKNIYLIAKENFINNSSITFISEDKYPFTKTDIITRLKNCPEHRLGWYYQQLLKLYVFDVIPNLTDNILILDADVLFLQEFDLFLEPRSDKSSLLEHKPYFTISDENHTPYYDHMDRLVNLKKVINKSGISHHMIFKRKIIKSLFEKVESIHNKYFWQVFIDCIDFSVNSTSLASEYEIYFNYTLTYFKDEYILREVKWKNCSKYDIENLKNEGYLYLGIQDYFINNDTTYRIE